MYIYIYIYIGVILGLYWDNGKENGHDCNRVVYYVGFRVPGLE